MKRLLFIALVIAIANIAKAQNIQLHYDLGEDRKMFTTTVEMFKPDKMGSTFFFIDLDYGSKASEIDGLNLAYWEIARSFKWNESQKFEPRVEYNGGFGRGEITINDQVNQYHYSINSAWLIGAQYTWNTADFSKVFTLQANFKTIQDKDAGFQITGVWGLNFFNKKLSFTGFADFWKEENTFTTITDASTTVTKTDFVFLTEPQLWYNLNDKFSLGTEIEISSNFGGYEGSVINPTVAAKWNF